MKRHLFGVALTAAVLALASSAHASVSFDIGANGPSGNHWTLGSGWGFDPNEGGGADLLGYTESVDTTLPNVFFTLFNPGDSYTFNFGTFGLGPNEGNIDSAETNDLGLTANLTFDLPTVGLQSVALSATAFTGGSGDPDPEVNFTGSPTTVLFGNGGKFQVELLDFSLNGNTKSTIAQAKVTLLTKPVPEPGSVAVWGGLTMLGFVGLRRRMKK